MNKLAEKSEDTSRQKDITLQEKIILKKDIILLLNGTGKEFELGLGQIGSSGIILERVNGKNISAHMNSACKKLLAGRTPSKIYVLTGPGSFTSTRLSIVTAKILGLCFNLEPIGCTIMDCLKSVGFNNEQVVLETGTALYFVYDLETDQTSLKQLDQINLDKKIISNFSCSHWTANMGDLLPGMLQACASKNEGNDLEPFYAIQPSYLHTVNEINDEQRKEFL